MNERNIRWDILKALMLIILSIGHVGGYFPALSMLVRYAWAPFGYFSMAEAFVFASAVITGVTLSRRENLSEMWGKLSARILRIYKHYFFLTAFAIMAVIYYPGTFNEGDIYKIARDFPITTLYLSALFVITLPLLDILAFYFLVLLPAPILVIGFRSRARYAILSVSIALWVLSQIYHPNFALCFPIFRSYNPFAWQFLFVLGLYYGAVIYPQERSTKTIDLLALIIAIGCFLMRHQFLASFWPDEMSGLIVNWRYLMPIGVVVSLLAFCRSLNFLALLEYDKWPELQWLGNWIGRESLLVYCWSVFVYYLFALLGMNLVTFSPVVQSLIFAVALVGMLVPVYVKRRFVSHVI